MFKRDRPDQVTAPTSSIETYQFASDPKTEAAAYFARARTSMELAQIHPWHAPDRVMLQAGLAAIAYSNDRFAEIIYDHRTADRRDRSILPVAMVTFATELSSSALQRMIDCNAVDVNDTAEVFTEATINDLYPEAMLPYWPTHPLPHTLALPDWQGTDQPPVSAAFVQATVEAGRDLQGATHQYLGELSSAAMVAVPLEYASVESLIRDNLMTRAEAAFEIAQGIAFTDGPNPEALTLGYGQAHDGYILAMHGFTAVFCPPVLGPDFVPSR